MKIKFSLLIALPLLMGVTSCEDPDKTERQSQFTYIYYNISDHDLELSIFNSGEVLRKETIPKGHNLKVKKYTYSGIPAPFEADSAYVLFKDPDRYVVHLLNPTNGEPQGIFDIQDYEGVTGSTSQKIFEIPYLITEEDYDNASPL